MSWTVLTVRRAAPADAAALETMARASLRQLGSADYGPEQIEAWIGAHGLIDPEHVVDGTLFLAEAAGEPVGCAAWSGRAMSGCGDGALDGSDGLDPNRDPVRIRTVFVHPAWARRGIATTLMGRVETAAREAGYHRGFRLLATLIGVPLYRRLGYAVERPGMFALPGGHCMPGMWMAKGAAAVRPAAPPAARAA
jgi:GNAT superfamily N-acetyltransferase